MKKRFALIMMAVLVMAMFMTSCSSGEFGLSCNSEKSMSVTADSAGDDMSSTAGTLVVAEGEEVAITPALESGQVTVDFIDSSGFDDEEEVPDVENLEASATATVSGSDETIAQVAPGEYVIRATGGDKATGTVEITVRTASK